MTVTQLRSLPDLLLLTLLVTAISSLVACSSGSYYPDAVYIQSNHHIRVDSPLSQAVVDTIKPGVTQKYKILDLFGPPTAIARKNKVMTMPPPGHLKSGFIEVNSETFFEAFLLKHGNTDNHIVYYYYHPSAWDSESRLWVYIDETTGVVDDYLFRAPQERLGPPSPEVDTELEEDVFE